MAYGQVRVHGMNDKVGILSFPEEEEENVFGRKPYSKQLAALIDEVTMLLFFFLTS